VALARSARYTQAPEPSFALLAAIPGLADEGQPGPAAAFTETKNVFISTEE
jgi:hypothetical protein